MKEVFVLRDSWHGPGSVKCLWDPKCKFLATCGSNRRVHIWDRTGGQVHEFALPGAGDCHSMEWDTDGEVLAVMQHGEESIIFFNAHSNQTVSLHTTFSDLTFMKWARAGPYLAVGTKKGNLIIYNKRTMKKVILQGKHSRAITCGMWNVDNKLALGAKDKRLTISDSAGTTLHEESFKLEPVDVQFSEQKMDEKQLEKESTVSINMGKKTILLYNIADHNNPFMLVFQEKYGEIVKYMWFGDGYILVGFSKGYVVAISTHVKEVGEELQSIQVHGVSLQDVVYSPQMDRFASCGSDGTKQTLRVVQMADSGWKNLANMEEKFSDIKGVPQSLDWSSDGQILTVATDKGAVYSYLMSTPVLCAGSTNSVAYLSSLRTVTVTDVSPRQAPTVEIDIIIEPKLMALGPNHLAVGMNNRVWFYRLANGSELVNEMEYVGTVQQLFLNSEYSVALCEGKAYVHKLNKGSADSDSTMIFPPTDDCKCTSIALTENFLVYGTDAGTINYLLLGKNAMVDEYRHDNGITRVCPNPSGTRTVVIDNTNRAFVYSPVDARMLPISKFPASVSLISWDPVDLGVFIAMDTKIKASVVSFSYRHQTIKGPTVSQLSYTKLPYGFHTALVYNGRVWGQAESTGNIQSACLSSHEAINMSGRRSAEKMKQALNQLINISRLKDAWELALVIRNEECYKALAAAALEQLDVDLAIRVYQQLEDVATVMALEKIKHIDDKYLLGGYIYLVNKKYDQAQNLFLHSSAPRAALDMRRDLMQWEDALKLASQLAPREMPSICREYAHQLEFKGDYAQALDMYKQGITQDPKDQEQNRACRSGVIRMTLRMGDIQRGRHMAKETQDKRLIRDCAIILQDMKQFADAAEMFVLADAPEKAAELYIQNKDFANAAPLMKHITAPKLHAQYAKAKLAEGNYRQAAEAFERAKDFDSVVKLLLHHLDNPQKAFAIVRRTGSSEGATMVAAYCQQKRNWQGAIEFMLMSDRAEEAFQLAKAQNEMETFAKALGNSGTIHQYMKVANYYEEATKPGKAAKFYAMCGQPVDAVKLYLQCEEEYIDDAIEVLKQCQGKPEANVIKQMLLYFLMGDADGVPKDPKYVYKVHIAVGNWAEAAQTAIFIADAEQADGNYRAAHTLYFEAHRDLSALPGVTVPEDLRNKLLLLHSYTLVKPLVKMNDHSTAARMLLRVAGNISKFPKHVVPILTSTVIECMRAKLKQSSRKHATTLMKPEYRKAVSDKYIKKIQAIVRRPSQVEEKEPLAPCPFCDFMIPETQLDCPQCKNTVPYCVSTGKHVVLDDFTLCPNCKFPALFSAFRESISATHSCPMCKQSVNLASVLLLTPEQGKKWLLSGGSALAKPDRKTIEVAENSDDSTDDEKS